MKRAFTYRTDDETVRKLKTLASYDGFNTANEWLDKVIAERYREVFGDGR